MPKRLAVNANDVSSRPYRVTGRVTSWLDSTQVAGAPTGPCAASVMSIDSRSCLASHGRAMKSKLNAVCISSGRRYCANRALSWQPDLADEDARALVGVGDGAPAAVDVVQLVAVDVRVLARSGVRRAPPAASRP